MKVVFIPIVPYMDIPIHYSLSIVNYLLGKIIMPLGYIDIERRLQQVPDTALIQLVYVSNATLKTRLNSTITTHIEKQANGYNKQHGITGILCYSNGQFLQCIEGNKLEIVALVHKIFTDKRHNDFKIPLVQRIDKRMFSDWRMRLLFLERWLWSLATKEQATSLSSYLPFTPHNWSAERTGNFLQSIEVFATQPYVNTAGVSDNTFGNMCRHFIGPHQAFLVIQSVLLLLTISACIFFWL